MDERTKRHYKKIKIVCMAFGFMWGLAGIMFMTYLKNDADSNIYIVGLILILPSMILGFLVVPAIALMGVHIGRAAFSQFLLYANPFMGMLIGWLIANIVTSIQKSVSRKWGKGING